MADPPLELLIATIWTYWFCVGVMIVRVRRKTRHGVGLVPKQSIERYLWLILVPAIVLWLLLPYLALIKTSGPFAVPDFAWQNPVYAALRWAATIVGAICLFVSVRSWLQMGKNWRMAVNENEKTELLTEGMFRHIRHPIYAFQMVLMLCTVLVVATAPMLVVAVVHLIVMNIKARNEERYLLQTHGESYADYLARTGRFMPRLVRDG